MRVFVAKRVREGSLFFHHYHIIIIVVVRLSAWKSAAGSGGDDSGAGDDYYCSIHTASVNRRMAKRTRKQLGIERKEAYKNNII